MNKYKYSSALLFEVNARMRYSGNGGSLHYEARCDTCADVLYRTLIVLKA
jgi:hypothetical protein